MRFAYVVYKLTFPNGKIYIGKDESANGHSVRYFGSWSNDLVWADFTKNELRDFTLRKEILFESLDARRSLCRLRCSDRGSGLCSYTRRDRVA